MFSDQDEAPQRAAAEPPQPELSGLTGVDSAEAVPVAAKTGTTAGQWIREIATTLIEAAALYLLLALVFGRFEIKQVSMEPTFSEGQYVLVNRLGSWADWALVRGQEVLQFVGAQPAYATDGSPTTPRFGPQRGQVVVLYIQPDQSGDALIKRVVGLPGETIEIRDGAVWVNGALLDEPYLSGVRTDRCDAYCVVTLPANGYFVMGDNRSQSRDSRSFGPIPAEQIVGEVVLRYLPLDKISFYP